MFGRLGSDASQKTYVPELTEYLAERIPLSNLVMRSYSSGLSRFNCFKNDLIAGASN